MLDLEAIKQRLAAAAPGPWENVDERHVRHAEPNIYAGEQEIADVFDNNGYNNSDLVAHAPADIAALIGEVGRLQKALEERAISYELLEITAHNFHAFATFPKYAAGDCRLCNYRLHVDEGHAADCPYALADEALRQALTKEEPTNAH